MGGEPLGAVLRGFRLRHGSAQGEGASRAFWGILTQAGGIVRRAFASCAGRGGLRPNPFASMLPQERGCKPPADRRPPVKERLFYFLESIGFLPSNVFSKTEITSPDTAASDGGWGCYFGKPILQGKEWNSLPPADRRSFPPKPCPAGASPVLGHGGDGRAGERLSPSPPPSCGSGKGEPAGVFKLRWTAHLNPAGRRSTHLPAGVQLEGKSR